jgi:hypothetical protein
MALHRSRISSEPPAAAVQGDRTAAPGLSFDEDINVDLERGVV